LAGGLYGAFSGPIVAFLFIFISIYFYNYNVVSEEELLAAPFLGGIFGAMEGACLGAIWGFVAEQPRRLTIARLMLIVAIAGPGLAFVVDSPSCALFALANSAFLLPVLIAVLIAFVRKLNGSSQIGKS
jgi:hypothetical protein